VTSDDADLHSTVADRVRASVGNLERPIDPDTLRRRVRNSATRAVRASVKRRPVVLPVVIEV
jgi:mRNA degradation ribonuclease J1/J2